MTGFYMKCNAGLKWVNGKFVTNFSSVFANVGKAVFTTDFTHCSDILIVDY